MMYFRKNRFNLEKFYKFVNLSEFYELIILTTDISSVNADLIQVFKIII